MRFAILHAEGLVSLLQSAGGEVLERVDVVAEVEPALLAGGQRQRGHEVLARDLAEGRVASHGVHQQLAVQGEAY